MENKKKRDLVSRPGTDLAGQQRRTNPVIARMTGDLLARARAHDLSAARFRIGEYLLREPDYRQILHWAEALGMAPEGVLEELAASRVEPKEWEHWMDSEPIAFALEDGAIVSLAWDFDRMPLIPETWQEGLQIRTLGFQKGDWPDASTALRPHLP